jgi:hypothetical protein
MKNKLAITFYIIEIVVFVLAMSFCILYALTQ